MSLNKKFKPQPIRKIFYFSLSVFILSLAMNFFSGMVDYPGLLLNSLLFSVISGFGFWLGLSVNSKNIEPSKKRSLMFGAFSFMVFYQAADILFKSANPLTLLILFFVPLLLGFRWWLIDENYAEKELKKD